MRLTILGSGSKGNSAFLDAAGTRLLIDAGLSSRQIIARLAATGNPTRDIDGIILTHEHGDHIEGLTVLAVKSRVPVYCNQATMEAVRRTIKGDIDFRLFRSGQGFGVGSIGIDTFVIPHDAVDPVGFILEAEGRRIGFSTDIGRVTPLLAQNLADCDVIAIESNHDAEMLANDETRPLLVKKRAAMGTGHLSNLETAQLLRQVASDRLQQIFLLHLSGSCNTPTLAYQATTWAMREIEADIGLQVARQDQPLPAFEI